MPCPGDLDGDGIIAVTDILLFLSDYGCDTAPCIGDVDGDDLTTVNDLLLLLSEFSRTMHLDSLHGPTGCIGAVCLQQRPRLLSENGKRRAAAAIAAQSVEPYRVDNWYGTWTGLRPSTRCATPMARSSWCAARRPRSAAYLHLSPLEPWVRLNWCKATMTGGSQPSRARGRGDGTRDECVDRYRLRSDGELHRRLPPVCLDGG